MNITDIFSKNELTETSSNVFKTVCPHCDLQGGRTEGFILFPQSNISYCHSSGKWFTLFQTVCLKLGLIQCIEGNEQGECPYISKEEKEELYKRIKEEKGNDFVKDLKLSEKRKYDFLIFKLLKNNKKTLYVDIDKVSNFMIDIFDIKTVAGIKTNTIYIYDNGVWIKKGKNLIEYQIEKLLENFSNNYVVIEIIKKIERKTFIDMEEFDKVPIYKLCVENGVLDLENINNIKFLSHSKKYYFKTKLPVFYDDTAECPNIMKFINEIFHPSDIKQVQEWIGHLLIKKYLFKKAVIIHGERNTGKSVFMNLLTTFMGENNVSGLSLQKISRGKSFDLYFLKNKMINLHDDLSEKDLSFSGGFKLAVGDAFITGEKKFGDFITFKNYAKHTFSCNQIPAINSLDDDAYFSRWLIWKTDNKIDKENKDINLINKLTTKKELSGLLKWAIQGLGNLLINNGFSNEKSCDEIKKMMISSGNSYSKFASEMLKEEIGSKVTKQEMFEAYCHYCTSQTPKISPQTKDSLGKQLPKYAPYLISSSNGVTRYWLNVKIIPFENMTSMTPLNLIYAKSELKNNANYIHINFPKVSFMSAKNGPKNEPKKVSEISVTKKNKTKKTDQKIQFWDENCEETKHIKNNCSKEDILKYIKENPNYQHTDLRAKFGLGSYKIEAELKQEKKINKDAGNKKI